MEMDTAPPNTDFLMKGLLPAQGAPLSTAAPSQRIDTNGESGIGLFDSSMQASLKALSRNGQLGEAELQTQNISVTLAQILGGNAASSGTDSLYVEGQEFAVGLSQDQLAEMTANLKSLGFDVTEEQLASLKYTSKGAADSAGQQINSVESLLALIDSSSSLGNLANAQASDQIYTHFGVLDGSVAATELDEKRLLERMNTALPRSLPQTGVAKVDMVIQPSPDGIGNGTTSGQHTSLLLAEAASPQAAISIPVLLGDNQSRNELLDSAGKHIDTNLGQQMGRTVGSIAPMSDARSLQSFIQTPLDDPRWQNDFSNKVFMLARGAGQGQIQVAEIRLNPQHMGLIDVKVVMDHDQASVSFIAQHSAVRDAIESSLPRLREMFHSSGLMLADADVSEQSLQDRQRQGSHTSSGQSDGQPESVFSLDQSLLGEIDVSATTSVSIRGLDLYA